eukprot:m.271867 g.271867  ORF g.271867 m.271867 type:complete len:413 (+) comp97819_c0_seq1:438-1676(+)
MKPKHKSSAGSARHQHLIALLPALMSAALRFLIMSMLQFYSEKQLQILKTVGNEKRETLLAINDVASAQQTLQGEIQAVQDTLEHVQSAVEEVQPKILHVHVTPKPPLFYKNGTLRELPQRRLFIIINSHLGGERRRAAIREGWLKTLQTLFYHNNTSNDTLPMQPHQIEARFFVGSSSGKSVSKKQMHDVQIEIQTFNDVTVVEAQDEYQTLGTKVPLLYRHVTNNYDCDFVAKVDDDVYVNVRVFTSLINRMSTTKSYLGRMFVNQPVATKGKNSEPGLPSWITKFPVYASGCATIISNDLAQLLANPPLTPMKMLNDDAFLGLLFLPFNVTYVNELRIFPWGFGPSDANKYGCLEGRAFAALHYVMPVCTPAIHQNVTRGLPICNSQTCRVDQGGNRPRFLKPRPSKQE